MKTSLASVTGIFLLSLQLIGAATLYVDLNNASPAQPYSSWSTAATNIQEAIDTASAGDLVLVTNGVYAAGGKVLFGDLTNRVALDKPIAVQSVNGPWFTTIRGNGATNGLNAVRCAWITNGATLQGFTLTAGATRSSGDPTNLLSGGGALCMNTNALLRNCLVISNLAHAGGGVFQGVVLHSAIIGNRSLGFGSGVAYATLINCTVVSNLTSAATVQTRHTNSIVYHNFSGNYSGGTFEFSCATPLPPGTSNISGAPQLFPDGIHLQSTSPCRSAGTNLAIGTDIDGQGWANPPSMGCDEWREQPIIIAQPYIQQTIDPIGFRITVAAAGQEPFTCYWTRNGERIENDDHFSQASTTNLVATGISGPDAGLYQVVVSNAFGMVTSVVAQLSIRYVDAGNLAPLFPYTSWNSAATKIQLAIDAAGEGDLVLVTNGVYATGGKVMAGDLTNRVVIDKAVAVRSVNGPWATTIQGGGATNGTAAVRCAWLTNGAILQGFTLTAGATRTTGDVLSLRSGGGVWGTSTNAIVSNCIIISNTAIGYGGGFYQGTLRNSYVTQNHPSPIIAGAVANADLVNCTVVSNTAFGVVQAAGGVTRVTNSIVYYNLQDYSGGGAFAFTCTTPLPAGIGNFTNAPLFQLNGLHLSSISPCRAAGTNVSTGTDLFGQAWLTPPSLGCVEWLPAPTFEIQPLVTLTNNPGGFAINFRPGGQAPFTYYWFRDGVLLSDDGHFAETGTTNLVVRKLQHSDVGNYWVVVSNSFGMATSQVARLVIHFADAAGSTPASPYTTWSTAATTIQAAIDASQPGEIVMVANGIYSTGGKIMAGDLLNRVAIDKAITLMSLNGYRHTVIEGAWDPSDTNGLAAIRGAWMTNGAVMVGFTIRNGATRAGNVLFHEVHSGGGIWAASTNVTIANCMLTNNSARFAGGGIYSGTLRNSIVTRNTVDGVGFSGGGGGSAYADLRNCTLYLNNTKNSSTGGGTAYGTVRNCIVLENYYVLFGFQQTLANNSAISPAAYSYSCSYPLPAGVGNIAAFPSFLDADFHLPSVSPCRSAGSSLYATGEDMDGEAWANPPAMGADEVVDANLVGPISLSVNAWQTNTLVGSTRFLSFWDSITGRVSRIDWDFGDGVVVPNINYFASHSWTNSGTYTVTSKAYNNDNPGGVSASIVIEVLPLIPPGLQSASLQTNGFTFSFPAQEGARYTVQYTTNLTAPLTWNTLQSIFFSPGGTTQITDTAYTNAARFYRVLAQ